MKEIIGIVIYIARDGYSERHELYLKDDVELVVWYLVG